MRTSVLIVDDHEDFRASARALLELQGFEVVADVEDGEAALAAAELLRPDVVLLDVQLPGMDGFDVAERLAEQQGYSWSDLRGWLPDLVAGWTLIGLGIALL